MALQDCNKTGKYERNDLKDFGLKTLGLPTGNAGFNIFDTSIIMGV